VENNDVARLKIKVAELEQENQSLRKISEHLRLALDGTGLGLWDWNIKTNEVVFNDTFGEMLGYGAEEINPDYQAWSSRIHPDDEEETIEALNKHLAGETDFYETKHRLKTKQGGWEWIFDRGMVVERDAQGMPLRAAGTCRIITKEKEYELAIEYHKNHLEELVAKRTEELAISEKLARDANQAKSEFLANVSHELRTPMHGILSYSSLGESRIGCVSSEKIKNYFQNIRISGERLLNLLNDLLDLSKLESGKLDLDIMEHNINELLHDCVAELAAKISEQGLKVEMLNPSKTIFAYFDRGRIFQVMINILSNAIKYSPVRSTIYINYFFQDNMLHVSITDQGIGIPADEIESIFDEFVQSKHQNTRSGMESTGLGLAICKKIILAHEGKIWVESKLNEGTTFSFKIPQ